jgi:hypothetical protein
MATYVPAPLEPFFMTVVTMVTAVTVARTRARQQRIGPLHAANVYVLQQGITTHLQVLQVHAFDFWEASAQTQLDAARHPCLVALFSRFEPPLVCTSTRSLVLCMSLQPFCTSPHSEWISSGQHLRRALIGFSKRSRPDGRRLLVQ